MVRDDGRPPLSVGVDSAAGFTQRHLAPGIAQYPFWTNPGTGPHRCRVPASPEETGAGFFTHYLTLISNSFLTPVSFSQPFLYSKRM